MPHFRFVIYYALGCIFGVSLFALLGYSMGPSAHLIDHRIASGVALLGIGAGWRWRRAVFEYSGLSCFFQRFGDPLHTLKEQFSTGDFGQQLTLRVAACLAACWCFGDIARNIPQGPPAIDRQVATWLHQHALPRVTETAEWITFLGDAVLITAAALICAGILTWRRDWYRLLALALAIPGGGLLNVLLKLAFHRERPWFSDPIVTPTGYSFPSGHTMTALLMYGLLCAFIWSAVRVWHWRAATVLMAIILIVAVGMTRIYLGAHYLTDVLGAMAAGFAWLVLSLGTVDLLRRRAG